MRAVIVLVTMTGVAQAAPSGLELVGITAGTRAGDGAGFALARSDWNSTEGLSLGANVEMPVWQHVRAVLRVEDLGGDNQARPGAGLAYVLAPYATAYVLYKAEGFSEPEGEIEAALAFAHGPLAGSVTYGQDVDARNRDLEGALAARAELAHNLFAGGLARYRDALGTTGEALARDGFGGATATLVVDRLAFTAMAGVAGVQMNGTGEKFQAGPAATLAIGAAF
jgi:hypothetical protein